MNNTPPIETREVWLRGPLPDVPPLLQPIAHALMQAREEVKTLLGDFPETLLWEQPTNPRNGHQLASAGFHLQHLTGVLDRLFTYARREPLSDQQLATLAVEGKPTEPRPTGQEMIRQFNEQVEKALFQLRQTDERTLTEVRSVGRSQLPSTVIGLLTHSAEHTMRHVGQLLVTSQLIAT
ncbi:DinB family protein [Spirosoma sp. BT702]|uniref:DinB family protein n=1 Tax=Spirosoma profusum TaxID=2771354 RepID=A0A926XYF2_9BACT|nr:DinB family protein [Spirosoma profusum]MBD2703249.1 DinB family protein [Spirosoma profusum]